MVLADIRGGSSARPVKQQVNRDLTTPEYKQIDLRAFETSQPDFVAFFTEDKTVSILTTKSTRRILLP